MVNRLTLRSTGQKRLRVPAGDLPRRWATHPRIIEIAGSKCDKPVDGHEARLRIAATCQEARLRNER